MTFKEILAQVLDQLQRESRVSYRALKRQFGLDDEYLEDLKAELIDAKQLAFDEDGKVLVWRGEGHFPQTPNSELQTLDPRPVSYTPSRLAARIRAEQAAMETRGVTDGERETITALFTDLKGSTTLIEDLDPEEARAIIDPALQIMMDAVHRYEGYVAQSLGDGIFALFGAPIAHEDHPQRALYAALRDCDLLVMPTLPLKATRIPPADVNREEYVARAFEMLPNTCPFDVTGHPAMTVRQCRLSLVLCITAQIILIYRRKRRVQ
jgi:class 3 adenylate cyclase